MKEKIKNWLYYKEQLDYFKEQEMLARREIVKTVFPVYSEGTNEKEVDGITFKFRATMSRKLIVPNEVLEEKIASGEIPEEVFRKKYELSKTVYNKLTEEQLMVVEQIIETKDNAPILEVNYEQD